MTVSGRKRICSAFLIFLLTAGIVSGPPLAGDASAKTGISARTSQTVSVGTVTASSLNVREAHTAASKIIGALLRGSNAYIISNCQGWYKITFNSGTGWVSMAYLTDIRPLSNPAGAAPGPSAPIPSSSSPSTSGGAAASSGGASSSSAASASAASSDPTAFSASSASDSTVNSSAAASSDSSSAPGAVRPVSALPSKVVAGYYANWSAYSGFTPDKIRASMLNVVHYAFADIGPDLRIAADDPSVDYSNFAKLAALKKNYPGLKTLISVGGWDGSARFSDMVLTDATRRAFAQSCVGFIRQYGFDGVDIDWEYPVSGGAAGRPVDKTNFTLLMQTLRSVLDAQAAADGKYYYLTFAGGASNGYVGNVQLSQLAGCVDYAVDMTYDLHGPWDTYADLNAPLYTPADPSPQYKISVDSSLRAWRSAGFPAGKLVMGVPFYGYVYSGVGTAGNGLYSRFTSAKAISFDSIVSNYLSNSLFASSFQPAAQVPTLFGGNTFISYDSASSIAMKAQYSASHGFGGVSAWELSCDKSNTLLSSAYNSLH